jgi:hypothetical protein
MSIEEKLQAMEALWADLTRNQEDFESPHWHKQMLDEREQRIESGKESFIDWELAKKQLREVLDERWAAFLNGPSAALTLEEFQQPMKAIRSSEVL